MKIGLLNDLPVAGCLTPGFGSGAELTSGRFIREGHKRGHIVDAITPDYCHPRTLAEYDLLVVKNVTRFSPEQMQAIMARPYVAWPSDYAWNRWRLYFAFQEKDRRNPSIPAWTKFFTQSRLNVFLSPLHQRCYEWAMPAITKHPSMLSPPPVDEDLFRPSKEGWTPKTACTINGGLDFKGLHNNLKWAYDNPDHQFTFIGSIRDHVDLPPNAKHAGTMSLRHVAEVIGRTEVYVELPKHPQPFNQSAVQGFLACKRVVTNDLLGAAGFPWFRPGGQDDCRDAMRRTLPDLWTRLEQEGQALGA